MPLRAPWLVLLVAACLAEGLPVMAQEVPGPALVVVVDPGRTDVRADRLRRGIARVLERSLDVRVVRITDAGATGAAGTLTLAHARGFRWLVRFEPRGESARSAERAARADALEATLSEAAVSLVVAASPAASARAVEGATPEPSAVAASAPSQDLRADWASARPVVGADELLDPFAQGERRPAVVALTWACDVLDPFTDPLGARHARAEVLDPWRP
jgi:hypothetical protein